MTCINFKSHWLNTAGVRPPKWESSQRFYKFGNPVWSEEIASVTQVNGTILFTDMMLEGQAYKVTKYKLPMGPIYGSPDDIIMPCTACVHSLRFYRSSHVSINEEIKRKAL